MLISSMRSDGEIRKSRHEQQACLVGPTPRGTIIDEILPGITHAPTKSE